MVSIQSGVYGLLHRLQELGNHDALAGLGSLLHAHVYLPGENEDATGGDEGYKSNE
jgi:hypothetical protein